MSLRDIYGNNDDKPVVLNTEPLGNGSGLGDFHTINPEEREPNNMPKIIGGLAVALMVGAVGAYVYSMSGTSNAMPPVKPITTAQAIPPAPATPPAATPAADTSAAPVDSSALTTPAAAPAAPVATPEPVKSASADKPAKTRVAKAETKSESSDTSKLGAASARMAADANAPATPPAQQQAAVTSPSPASQQTAAVPEPVSPTAPSSSVASNAQPAAPEVAQPQQPVEQAQPQQPVQGNETGAAAPAAAQPAPQPQQ